MMSGDRTHVMRYGRGPRGLIGITVKAIAMKTWALSLHICCRMQNDIREMTLAPARDVDETPSQRGTDAGHDANDRDKLRNKLEEFI